MALHKVELFAFPERSCGVSEPAFATDASPFSGVTDMNMPVRFYRPLPLAGDNIQFEVTAIERFQRAGDKTFRAAIGIFALPAPGEIYSC